MDILHVPDQTVAASRVDTRGVSKSRQRSIAIKLSFGVVIGLMIALVSFFVSGQGRVREAEAVLEASSISDPNQAIIIFEQAQQHDPVLLQHLAEAYLLAGRNKEALAALQEAFKLQPQNLLIEQALACAYEASGDTNSADGMWATQGLSAEYLRQLGRSYATKGIYDQALAWYWRALRAGLDTSDLKSQLEVAMIAMQTGKPIPADLLNRVKPLVHSVDPDFMLNGGNLIWMPEHPETSSIYGKPLNTFPSGDLKQGVFWWSGIAGAFVQIYHTDDYTITIRANHRPSPGGQIAVMIDSTPLSVLTLTTHWQDYHLTTHLEPGVHLLRLYYLVDIGDAFIDSITLNPIAN